jgi:hypothetical protein
VIGGRHRRRHLADALAWIALAGAVGNVVPALLYALTGAVATSLTGQVFVFAVVIAVAAACWLVGRRATKPAGRGQQAAVRCT